MPSGFSARAIVAWPSTSSGLVGSSIHHGLELSQLLHVLDRLRHVPHWLASTMSLRFVADRFADDCAAANDRPPHRGRLSS